MYYHSTLMKGVIILADKNNKKDDDSSIFVALKYEIYPNNEQVDQNARTFGCTRKVYNMGLELQNGLYLAEMGRMNKTSLNNYCNQVWKDEFPYLREVDKFALTNALYDLESAFTNFFEGRANKPKFKSKRDHYYSYTTNFTNNNIEIERPKNNTNKGRIKLPKLGWVDANITRLPEADWVLKNATVSLTPSGKYFVSIVFKYDVKELPVIVPTLDKTLGLDYSSPLFYVDSNGEAANVPHWYREAEKRLAREQRRLSKMTKGSNNYEKQRILVAKLHEKVANKRKDFCHKLSREIANSYDVVCVEDLNLKNLAQTLNFGKATNDNGFGMFRTFLKYKLERQGKYYVVIDKWYPSTKTCHECGGYNEYVKLGDSIWVCPHCGAIVDRDPNAALNIKEEGFRILLSILNLNAA